MPQWIYFLQSHLTFTLISSVILGAIIGSFLTVIVHRYPKMLKNRWRHQCEDYLKIKPSKPPRILSLSRPRSHCPHCQQAIKPYHNIPIISYLLLKGHCAYCKQHISPQYFFIELISAITSLVIVARFGISWQMLTALILNYTIIVLAFIDIRHQLLPDEITLTMLWLGLLLNTFNLFSKPLAAILGAVFGYGILWVINILFKTICKKQGMGYGDFKMLAMLGAWLGYINVLNILMLAIFLALIINITLLLGHKLKADTPFAFGPYIAFAGWISLVFGPVFFYLLE